ncbi:cell division topological specificity factor MinE [Roseomonas marmotae]|uniref:Cell division topological specificity factor n=1 Tax=Roseomonas marmotae TaxID=2768161 RepID=A0ABS3KA11_9PROT|nr:cell division topological specificity factor MinE [Roseomonas marmotae]MBO1074292.1 cell division topological specificity factor MinE [Roseomonas marmotae]QTI78046.1 cell division topological specificity factor MinE [Roseomonas marmotae]
MSWIDIFRGNRKPPASAGAAKERLQIVLAHERISRTGEDFLPKLQKDLLEVISKYVAIDAKAVNVSLDRGGDMSTLAIEVELPGPKVEPRRQAAS